MVKVSNNLDRYEKKKSWRRWGYRPGCVWREWGNGKEFH